VNRCLLNISTVPFFFSSNFNFSISGEKAEERWNPTQSVESILLSVVSLLGDPNCSSPANVDAGVAASFYFIYSISF